MTWMRTLVCVAASVGSLDAGWAADWPQFRGPERTGAVAGTIAPWAEEGPTVMWRAEVGLGCAGMAVADGRVITAGQPDNGEDAIVALDAQSGQPLWDHRYPAPLDDNLWEGGPTATPTIDGTRVYALAKAGELFCLDVESGKVLWQAHLVNDLGGKKPTWGFSGSPLIVGDQVIVEPGGEGAAVAVLNKATGAVIWKAGSHEAGYSAPTLASLHGTPTLLQFHGDGLAAYAAKDGAPLWFFPWKTDWNVNAATPIAQGNRVFLSSGYGTGSAVIEVPKEGDPTVVWKKDEFANQLSSSVLVDDCLIGFHTHHVSKPAGNALACRTFDTGELMWEEPMETGTVTRVGDNLLVMTQTGELVLAEASTKAYKELARAQVATGKTWAAPAYAAGLLYTRNNAGELLALQTAK